jgi:hypothetical protein
MTAQLSSKLTQQAQPANFETFFTLKERQQIIDIISPRTCSDPLTQPPPCDVNLFFGVFFDAMATQPDHYGLNDV